MTGLDQILREEMIEEDVQDIMHMDNDIIDGFYPYEDEDFCNAILSDELDNTIEKPKNHTNINLDKNIADEVEDTTNDI